MEKRKKRKVGNTVMKEKSIEIAGHILAEDTRPFIVAEAGVNYYDIAEKLSILPLKAAEKMIEEAAKSGADAIKFQTYKAEKLTIEDSPTYWEENATQREFFKKYDKFGEGEFQKLSEYAKKRDIIFMSTPFDKESADFLDDLMPVFKIASADITNKPLLEHIARKGKPIFLSTGASTIGEIETALRNIKESGNEQVVLLHCILSYPTEYKDANLGMIEHLRKVFPHNLVGYSDHTMVDRNMIVLTIAAVLGAVVIEKHFTLDKKLPGNDHYHAMDPDNLKRFTENLLLLEKIIGEGEKKPIEKELLARKFARRSLVAKQDIPEGTIITEEMLTEKRPGTGISPVFVKFVVGRKATSDIKADTVISWNQI